VEYVGEARYAVKAQSPNGSSVLSWASAFLHEPEERLERMLMATAAAPGPLLATPHLSGALCPWAGGRSYRASILGLSLSTQRVDVVKALLEGVAFDLSLALDFLRHIKLPAHRMRATGGGARSAWWMQLKADICGVPIELSQQPEPGTFGAALLAGAAIGVYRSAGQAAREMANAKRCFEPSRKRARLYGERLELYQKAVKAFAALNTDTRQERTRT
jgi:xylulokinase